MPAIYAGFPWYSRIKWYTGSAGRRVKGQIGDKGSQGIPGPRGDRGREGPPGKSGPRGITGMKGQQGLMGMKGGQGAVGMKGERGIAGMKGVRGAAGVKGERGIMGMKGRKGEKGEKGESAKASQASVVPQTNWKQCVWQSGSGTDNGKIRDCAFNKLQSNSVPRVSFQGNIGVDGSSSKCNRWYFKFNGNECSGPMMIEAVVYKNWPSGNPILLHHRSFEGYCDNIPQGTVRVELWVRQCGGYKGNAYTGWSSVSRIMIEEVSRPQS